MEHWSLAVNESSSLTRSFWMGVFLQQVLEREEKCSHGSDPENDIHLTETPLCCRIKQAMKSLQEEESSLSPSVFELVTQSIARFQEKGSPNECVSTRFLLEDCTLDLSTVRSYLETEVKMDSKEYSVGGRKCAEMAHLVFKEILDRGMFDALNKKENFDWTQSPELFATLLKELKLGSPLRTHLGLLMGTAALERALGDVYLSVSKVTQCPLLLRDLLATRELEKTFGSTAVFVLCCLIGPPAGLNLRNILWHGFVSPTEIPEEFVYFLFVITSTLGRLLPPGSHSSSFRPFVTFTQDTELSAVFKDLKVTDISVLDQLLSNSFFILPTMLPTWRASLDSFKHERYADCLVLFLPCLEHGLRRVFACVNKCSHRVLTAESTILYTTFDEILNPVLPNGEPNKLISVIGVQKMDMLLDILVHPEGPRVRDRISHGEVDFNHLSRSLANHVTCLCMLFCAQYCLDRDTLLTPLVSLLLSIETNYVSIFHPLSLLKHELIQLVLSLTNWKTIPTPEPTVTPNEHSQTNQPSPEHAQLVHSDITREHGSMDPFPNIEILQALEFIQTDDKARLCEVVHLYDKVDSGDYSEFLKTLIDLVWSKRVRTLFMDRKNLELIGVVRRTVSNAGQAVCQIHETTSLRYTLYTNKQLRSRQRPNYYHLLSSLGLYQKSVVLLSMLSLVAISHVPLDSSTYKLIKYQKKLLQFSENFNSQSSPSRNRWEEVDKLCQSLSELMNLFLLHKETPLYKTKD